MNDGQKETQYTRILDVFRLQGSATVRDLLPITNYPPKRISELESKGLHFTRVKEYVYDERGKVKSWHIRYFWEEME